MMDILSVFGIISSVGPSVSQTRCVEYQNMLVSNEIFDYAAPRKFPFMVQIHPGSGTQFYNGFLISENFVLSTALPQSTEPFVMLRHLEKEASNDTVPLRPRIYEVIETFVHPDFNGDDLSSNIKLFKLNESIKFDDDVRPSCLPRHDLTIPKNLIQIGWDGSNTPTKDNLYQIKSQSLFDKKCKKIYESANASKFVSGIDNGTIFCAKPKKGERQMLNVVHLGFPVIDSNSDVSDVDTIIGFSSYHLKHGDSSIVTFVRVSSFIDWIEGIVWPDDDVTPTTTTPEIPDDATDSNTPRADINVTTTPKISDGKGMSNETKSDPLDSKTYLWLALPVVLLMIVLCASFVYSRRN